MNFQHSLLGAVGCEWGTASVYFENTYVCFIPIILPPLLWGPQLQHRVFIYVKNIIWIQKQNHRKIPWRFKSWMGFVRQILINLETSAVLGFLQLSLWCPLMQTCWWSLSDQCNVHLHSDGHSVTTEACTLIEKVCVVWRCGSSLDLFALCDAIAVINF